MLGRLSALATIAMMLACGGDPAPLEVKKPKAERGSDEARAERKRKKAEERRREEQEEADAREREERKERMRKRQEEEAGESAEPQEKRVAEREEPASSDDADEQERRERKERIRKREEEEARDAARLARAEEKKAKLEAAREAKLAKAEAEKAKKAKKKNVEEVDEDDEDAADEEPAEKKSKKNAEEADESDEEVAADDEGPKSTPFKKTPRKQTAAEKKAAAKKLAAEKKAAEKAAAAEKLAEKKAAAAEAKKQAAEEKAARKKAGEEKVAEEADEEPAEEEAKPEPKTNKRKATAKSEPEDKVDESEIEVDTASLPPPDPSEESNELDLNAGTPARDEEPVVVAPKTYAIDRRPLTLGRGKIDVHGGLVATAVTASNGMGGTTTASAQGLALGATYGIGAKGELGIDYTLGLHPGDAHGPFMLHGAYVAKQTEKLDIALSLGLAFDFVDSIDPGTMMTTTRTAKALQVGIWARYHLGAKLSAFSGLPALPSSAGNLGASAPLPPIPYQLSIGLSSVDAIALDIPAGLGYQATPKLYTFGVLDLAHLGMNNTTSAVLFSDFIPLSLGGFYAASKMDVGAVFSDDLKQGADYLRFDVVVRYSIK